MRRLFNPNNIVMQILSRVFDLMLLNFLFLISSIPVITLGASLSALYYVCLKIVRREDPYIWKNYWKAFRQNLGQSTAILLLFLAAGCLIGIDLRILAASGSSLFKIARIVLFAAALVLICMLLYVFPIISHFSCTTGQALRNSALMALAHLPCTALLLAMYVLIVYLTEISSKIFAAIILLCGLCGFSLVVLISCVAFDRIFRHYEPDNLTQTD